MTMLAGKRASLGLDVKTFSGSSGLTYIVFRTTDGGFHTFVEVEAKEAARDCGAAEGHNTRSEWKSIWDKAD